MAFLIRPRILLGLFLVAFMGALAAGWGNGGLSDQELLANQAKALDWLRGFEALGTWPWWTDSFNCGQSQAPVLGTALAYLPLILLSPMGPAGAKAAVLIFGAAAALAMFSFSRVLTRSDWTGLACAILYVLAPQFALRSAWNEHLVVSFCFLYPPLICRALCQLRMAPTTAASLGLAVSTAAMFLTFAKMAIVFMPAAALFAFWLWREREGPAGFWKGIGRSLLFFLPLAVLPLLPAWREMSGLALFEFDPLEAWQHSFSIHTPMSWLDRGGWLLQGLPSLMALDKAGAYAGVVPVLGILWVLFCDKKWARSTEAAPLRIFLAMALLLFWFALGPDGMLLSQWHLLAAAQGMKNWAAPLLWVAFVLPAILMVKFWGWRKRGAGLAGLVLTIACFYLLPGFLVFEWLSGVKDIRAPWSFWQVGGSFALAMTGGLLVSAMFRNLPGARAARLLALALLSAAVLDASVYLKEFFKPGLGRGAENDFRAVQEYLAAQEREGSVMPVSGRYFYLMTPEMSGRPIVLEAFQSYLMPRWSKRLLDATAGNPDLFRAYLKTGGVGWILLDRKDADYGPATEKYFRELLPVELENEHFLLMGNREALAPAFFSAKAVLFPEVEGFEPEILSKAGSRNFLAVPAPEWAGNLPGKAGRLKQTADGHGEYEMEEEFRSKNGPAFVPLPVAGGLVPGQIRLRVERGAGWVTLPQSYHVDWKARVNGQEARVYRGMGAFLSVPVGEGKSEVEFFFSPPRWYSWLTWLSAVSWGLSLGLLLAAGASPGWRQSLFGGPALLENRKGRRVRITDREEGGVQKALVIVPCYNEAVSIGETLDQVLRHEGVEVLVVDDASPDGTGALVRKRAEFGTKIHLLERSGKLGLASAYKDGFAWALRGDYDAVLEMDADLSHDPADIGRLLAALRGGADLAVGSRYLDGVRVINWATHRLFLSLFAGMYTRFFTGLPLSDPTSGFKAIRRRVLESMDWAGFQAEGYGFQIELHYRAWEAGYKLEEVPIVFTERRGGASKMSRQIAWEASRRVLQLAWERRRGEQA